jgi:peptide/nickel transport system substrate-binding protein
MRTSFLLVTSLCLAHALADDRLVLSGANGARGGGLVSAQRTEPKTLNWLYAADSGSREVLQRLMADLIHINRQTLQPEPALAKSWKGSADGLHWVLELREGIKFSDGEPFDADDVTFTFHVILDEKSHSPQRDLLMLDGHPVVARKLDRYRVQFDLPQTYSVADRLFDGVFILPRHKLEAAYKQGKLTECWPLTTAPSEIAGLGPFRLKQYVPGERITLERNPFYWKVDKAGTQLPYLDEVTFVFAGTEDNQVLRFEAGESDVINRLGARNFAALEKSSKRANFDLVNVGASLEYSFLFFNLAEPPANAPAPLAQNLAVLRRTKFRQAVAQAIDRESIVRTVYLGRAVPLAGPVPPGNRYWIDNRLPPPVRNLERARQLLASDGFKWSPQGTLLDPSGRPVQFSIITSNNNPERQQMASLIQDDLKQIGIQVSVIPLEFRSLLNLVQETRAYEACLLSLASPDADPNPDMAVWLSSGANHLWNPRQKSPATPWEAEIDTLMRRQLVTREYVERKRMFDRVQEILVEKLPLIALVSPNLLVGARRNLGNFRPALLEPYTLWNIDQLYWRVPASGVRP